MIELSFREKKLHDCKNQVNGKCWPLCCACEGRFHLPGCTTKKNKYKDCCEARHKMLYEEGHEFGIVDASIPMLPYK
jgi:hypothetical protein